MRYIIERRPRSERPVSVGFAVGSETDVLYLAIPCRTKDGRWFRYIALETKNGIEAGKEYTQGGWAHLPPGTKITIEL